MDKLFYLTNCRELHILLTGLSYTEIANKFYGRQKYKFIYRIRKIMFEHNFQNRRQLAFFAVTKGLVKIERVKFYLEC